MRRRVRHVVTFVALSRFRALLVVFLVAGHRRLRVFVDADRREAARVAIVPADDLRVAHIVTARAVLAVGVRFAEILTAGARVAEIGTVGVLRVGSLPAVKAKAVGDLRVEFWSLQRDAGVGKNRRSSARSSFDQKLIFQH